MNSDPPAEEILAAVADWLEGQAKQMSDRDAYFARVAVSALGIVRRELSAADDAARAARWQRLLGQDGDLAALNAALRAGTIDETTPGLFDELKAAARHQIAVDQPRYRASPVPPALK
jgi:hypothetical protein